MDKNFHNFIIFTYILAMMYWYRNTLNVLFLVISELYIIKQPISPKGLHSPHPLLHIWLNPSLYLLKYALSLTLGMSFGVFYNNKKHL